MVLISDTVMLGSRKTKMTATACTAAIHNGDVHWNSSNAIDKQIKPKPIDDHADDTANADDDATLASNDDAVDGFSATTADSSSSSTIHNSNNKSYVNHKNVFRDNCRNHLSFSANAATNDETNKQFSYNLGTILLCLFSKSLTMNILSLNMRMLWKIQNKNKNVNNNCRNNVTKHNKQIMRPAAMLAIIVILCSGAAMARPNGGDSINTLVSTTGVDDVSILILFFFFILIFTQIISIYKEN